LDWQRSGSCGNGPRSSLPPSYRPTGPRTHLAPRTRTPCHVMSRWVHTFATHTVLSPDSPISSSSLVSHPPLARTSATASSPSLHTADGYLNQSRPSRHLRAGIPICRPTDDPAPPDSEPRRPHQEHQSSTEHVGEILIPPPYPTLGHLVA
jgi:hypothetical protein